MTRLELLALGGTFPEACLRLETRALYYHRPSLPDYRYAFCSFLVSCPSVEPRCTWPLDGERADCLFGRSGRFDFSQSSRYLVILFSLRDGGIETVGLLSRLIYCSPTLLPYLVMLYVRLISKRFSSYIRFLRPKTETRPPGFDRRIRLLSIFRCNGWDFFCIGIFQRHLTGFRLTSSFNSLSV